MRDLRAVFLSLCFLLQMFIVLQLANAEAVSGWAFLAAEHKSFPAGKCGKYAKLSPRPFLAVLADSFGKNKKCLRRFMIASKGKPTYFQYYAGNGAGRRKRLYRYEFLNRLSADEYNKKLCSGDRATKIQVVKQARRLRRRCERVAHASATCLLSPELESQFTECAIERWEGYAKQAGWKEEQLVHNPVVTGPYQGRSVHILERHHVFGSAPQNYHLGIDGACASHCGQCGISGKQVTDNQILQWLAKNGNRDPFFSLWCPQHQGLFRDSGQAPEPRRRDIRVDNSSFASGNNLIGLNDISSPTGKHNLKRCKKVREFNSGNVAKESDHGGFVAVMVDKLKRAQLVQPNGKRHPLRYTGAANPYQGKDRHHYRHSQSFSKFPDNMVLRGRIKRVMTCFKLYKSGERHG